MDKIRDWLYIGNLRDTQDRLSLDAHRIGAMLQLAVEATQNNIAHVYLPVRTE